MIFILQDLRWIPSEMHRTIQNMKENANNLAIFFTEIFKMYLPRIRM